jgi:hypothetical protein
MAYCCAGHAEEMGGRRSGILYAVDYWLGDCPLRTLDGVSRCCTVFVPSLGRFLELACYPTCTQHFKKEHEDVQDTYLQIG